MRLKDAHRLVGEFQFDLRFNLKESTAQIPSPVSPALFQLSATAPHNTWLAPVIEGMVVDAWSEPVRYKLRIQRMNSIS